MINSSPEIPESEIVRKSVTWSYEYDTPEISVISKLIPTGTSGVFIRPYFPSTLPLLSV